MLALLRPVEVAAFGGVDRASAQRTAHLAQLAGARDLALGVGLLVALVRGSDTGGWVWAGALADGIDTAVVGSATARGRLGPAAGTALAVVAASAAVAVVPGGLRRGGDRRAEPSPSPAAPLSAPVSEAVS
jgi:peptide-methionine (R)-S-oxide reductase